MYDRLVNRASELKANIAAQNVLYRLKGRGVTEENVDAFLADLNKEHEKLKVQIKGVIT